MSGAIGTPGTSNYGMMGSLISHAGSVRKKLDMLTTQASAGLVANRYAGLGAQAQTSLDLGPQIAHAKTWEANITVATGNLRVTQTTMSQIQQIANNRFVQLPNLNNSRACCEISVRAVFAGWKEAESVEAPDSTDPAVW
jgi:hypothetical protein